MATVASKKALGIGLTDAVALLFVLVVPALSHLTAVPFYLLDPMRLAVLGALLASRSRVNGLVLAVALPLVSFAISGHPVFPKCLVIAAELSVNVLLFWWLASVVKPTSGAGKEASSVRIGLATFLSILLSKAFYYSLKALVLGAGLMQMKLVSTALWVQLVVAVLISAGFVLFWRSDRSR
ncbi:MAG: hypothetical protein IJL22_00080 [Bacteroidales bacterium]|nr:hypothetical protein [Bacteroidales bacterium]MBQ9583958.1 hypothetical protein [Bacteroidales bacterium]